jgi:hypothetical protein
MDILLNEPSLADKVLGVIGSTGAAGPPAPFGRTMPASGDLLGGMAPHREALQIANWIEGRPGFEVGALRGWEGQGPITSGHVENSQHYGPGYAGDVNYVGGGRFPDEMSALDWLNRRLTKRYGDDLTELIWREPDHWDHLHYGTRPGG